MNNDLISREALKVAIDHFQYTDDFCVKHQIDNSISLYMLKKIIDNAPTVVNEKLTTERPQGEWGKWIIAEVQCPNCFEYFEVDCYSTEELNKCPNCGADMRKPQTQKFADNDTAYGGLSSAT